MENLGKTFIKKISIPLLTQILKPYDFKVEIRRGEPVIYKKTDNLLFTVAMQVTSWDELTLNIGRIGYLETEYLLSHITGEPLIPIEEYPAICTLYIHPPPIISKKIAKKVSSQEEIEELIENFSTAFKEFYLPAFEKYSSPKEVLALWDSLDDKGRSDYFFSPYKHIKMIILSKMCKDLDYSKRCEDAYAFYKGHFENGVSGAEILMKDCEKVIKYLEENEV